MKNVPPSSLVSHAGLPKKPGLELNKKGVQVFVFYCEGCA